MNIKETNLLFESQLPSVLNAAFKGWSISVKKLQQLYHNPEFKNSFTQVMNMEENSNLKFSKVYKDIESLCEFAEKMSMNVQQVTHQKLRFNNPMKQKFSNESLAGDDLIKELEGIKSYLTKATDYISDKMVDINANWKDEKGKQFEDKMHSIVISMNSLSKCCSQIQNQLRVNRRSA